VRSKVGIKIFIGTAPSAKPGPSDLSSISYPFDEEDFKIEPPMIVLNQKLD
jgi:hypothetical protein